MINFEKLYEEEHIKNRLSYKQIEAKYNIPRGTWDYYIRRKLHLSYDGRKHVPNDTFFDCIDSEEKAYLLGYLYADGYIANDGRMGIRLANKDECIIRLIKQHICPQSPIEYTNNQNIHRMPQVSIRWKSEHMYKRLKELGFCIDKTHTNSNIFQHIPDNLKCDFIRGYCDGDGSIIFNKCKSKNYYKTAVTFSNGCKQILQDISDYFKPYIGDGNIKHPKNYYTLGYETAWGAYYVASKLYKNASIYLERKRNKALSIIEYRSNTELTGNYKRFPAV